MEVGTSWARWARVHVARHVLAPLCSVLPSALRRDSPAESTHVHPEFRDRPTDRERWLDEIVALPEGAHLRKVSRGHAPARSKAGNIKLIELSARRLGITRREALKEV